jgi:cell division GTPase FtsZ
MKLAEEGLGYMRLSTDTLIVIPNQNLFQLVAPETSLMQVHTIEVLSNSDLLINPLCNC